MASFLGSRFSCTYSLYRSVLTAYQVSTVIVLVAEIKMLALLID